MTKYAALLLASTLMISGCSSTSTTTMDENGSTTTTTTTTESSSNVQGDTTAGDMKREVGEALDATGKYFTQQRDKTTAEIKLRNEQLQGKLEGLKAERETASPERKNHIDIEIHGLEEQKAQLDEMGNKVKAASQEGWNNVKAGWENMKNTEIHVKTSSSNDRTDTKR